MRVQIAICTWNRSPLLAVTLDSLSHLHIPASVDWEILIVDNNSTDDTAQIVSRFAERLPVRYFFEPDQGHTHARNQAVEQADGDLLIWTDDDCRFNPNWLARYAQAAQDPTCDFWGAAILPFFLSGQPRWIQANWNICKGCFATRDLGSEPIEFRHDRLPYGANFAVRTNVQKQFQFDTQLGRHADRLVIGQDEIDLLQRLLHAGHRGQWIPLNPVEHLIPAERATPAYVYDYFVGQGIQLARKASRSATTRERSSLKRAAKWNWLMFKLKRPFVDSHTWLSHLAASALAQGQYDYFSGR